MIFDASVLEFATSERIIVYTRGKIMFSHIFYFLFFLHDMISASYARKKILLHEKLLYLDYNYITAESNLVVSSIRTL